MTLPKYKTHKFFRFLWKMNAILIFLAALTLIFVAAWIIIDEFFDNRARSRTTTQPLIDDPAVAKYPLRLGDFIAIRGTTTGRSQLVTEKRNSGISSSHGNYEETHNVLWINLNDGTSRWLLPNHESIVPYTEDIVNAESLDEAERSKSLATLFLIKEDVKDIDSSRGNVIITSPSGDQQKMIASDVRSIEAWDLINPNEVAVLCAASGYRLIVVSLDPLQKNRETPLEIPK